MKATFLPSGKLNRWLLVSVGRARSPGWAVLRPRAAAMKRRPPSRARPPRPRRPRSPRRPPCPRPRPPPCRWRCRRPRSLSGRRMPVAFADRFYGAWPDVDASFAQFADDATFYDPIDGDFLLEGKQQIVALHRWLLLQLSRHPGSTRKRLYLSGDGAAYRRVMENLWPPGVPEPADHPPVERARPVPVQGRPGSQLGNLVLAGDSRDGVDGMFRPGQRRLRAAAGDRRPVSRGLVLGGQGPDRRPLPRRRRVLRQHAGHPGPGSGRHR